MLNVDGICLPGSECCRKNTPPLGALALKRAGDIRAITQLAYSFAEVYICYSGRDSNSWTCNREVRQRCWSSDSSCVLSLFTIKKGHAWTVVQRAIVGVRFALVPTRVCCGERRAHNYLFTRVCTSLSLTRAKEDTDDVFLLPTVLHSLSVKNKGFNRKSVERFYIKTRVFSFQSVVFGKGLVHCGKPKIKMKFPTENPRKPGNPNPTPGLYFNVWNVCR